MTSGTDIHNTLRLQKKQTADYAMAVDLMAQIAKSDSEEEVIDKILNFFKMIFSPQSVNYLSFAEGRPDIVFCRGENPENKERIQKRLATYRMDSNWHELARGFVLKIIHGGVTFGIFEIDDIAFIDYKQHYINLSLNLAQICGLALENSRRNEELLAAREDLYQKNQSLQQALKEVRTLSGLLPICMHCKKIRDDKGYWNQLEQYIHDHSDARFSHGICTECLQKYYSDI